MIVFMERKITEKWMQIVEWADYKLRYYFLLEGKLKRNCWVIFKMLRKK